MLSHVITFYAGAFFGILVLALLKAAKDERIENEPDYICTVVGRPKECGDTCCSRCHGNGECDWKWPCNPKVCGHSVRK